MTDVSAPPPDEKPEAAPSDASGQQRETTSLALHFAHDIRSPVAAITMLAEVIRDELGHSDDPLHRRRLDLLHRAAQALDSLVDDLLTLSGQAPGVEAEIRTFRVDEMLEALDDALRPAAELWDVSMHISTSVGGVRTGRPAGIRHTLLNLASLLQSTGEDEVEIRAESLGDTVVRFSVSTPGRGPDPDSISAVSAVAAGSESRSPACFSHLGTEVAFRLVASMDSSLEVEAADGEGMRFWFDLDLPEAIPERGT